MVNQHTEIAVVGGGMVGAAMALGLAQVGLKVTVIERDAPADFNATALPDVRISALNRASVALLDSLGVWSAVQKMRCHPYSQLEVWETAAVCFHAAELGLPTLGHMVENSVLQRALWEALMVNPNIDLRCPAALHGMTHSDSGRVLHFTNGPALDAALVIGADGAESPIRQWAGIGVQGWSYPQACMLISVRCDKLPGMTTWQQFTPTGPRAFLPLFDDYASLVWYDAPARIQALHQLTLPKLEAEIAYNFPARLGQVNVLGRSAFPLARRHASRYVDESVVLVGDAAHTIHPLAGQGVNLGYRDVAELLDVLTRARDKGEIWSSKIILRRYQHRRRADNLIMQAAMDLFYRAFSNALPPLQIVRNLGLMAASRASALKRQALKYALGG